MEGRRSGHPASIEHRSTPRATARIEAAEIAPGLVARLDPRVLAADPEVSYTQDPPVTRPGLFACLAVDGERTTWVGLTTQTRRERLLIHPSWRSGGFRRWRLTPQYLTDGAAVWFGPKDAFAAASSEEVATASRNRARISDAGIAAILQEIEAQRHRRNRAGGGLGVLLFEPQGQRKKPRRRR